MPARMLWTSIGVAVTIAFSMAPVFGLSSAGYKAASAVPAVPALKKLCAPLRALRYLRALLTRATPGTPPPDACTSACGS